MKAAIVSPMRVQTRQLMVHQPMRLRWGASVAEKKDSKQAVFGADLFQRQSVKALPVSTASVVKFGKDETSLEPSVMVLDNGQKKSYTAVASVVNKHGVVLNRLKGSATAPLVSMRSSIKPVQLIPAHDVILAHGDTQQVGNREIAVMASSHWGTDRSVDALKQLLDYLRISTDDLKCGQHAPLDTTSEHETSPLTHQCSGNHVGMLLWCVLNDVPIENYRDPKHPVQVAITDTLKDLTGLEQIEMGTDGCGVPSYYLPVDKAAYVYAQLATHDRDMPRPFGLIAHDMISYPDIVGGHGLDRYLMEVTGGRLVAKTGVDGVIGVGHMVQEQGMVLRVMEGDCQVRDRLTIDMLGRMGWLQSDEVSKLQAMPQFAPMGEDGKQFDMVYEMETPDKV